MYKKHIKMLGVYITVQINTTKHKIKIVRTETVMYTMIYLLTLLHIYIVYKSDS